MTATYVYQHIRLDKNEPFYIGIGSSKYYNRAYRKKGRNKIWQRIANKTSYKVEIIYDNLSWEDACQKEKELIAKYGRLNNKTGILANLTDGGEGNLGAIISKEHRKAIGEANKKRIFTLEQRAAMAKRMRERLKDPLYREKLTNGLRNSDKAKESARLSCIRRKGFKLSEETKRKMSKSKQKPIVQKSLDGGFIRVWNSMHGPEIELGFSQGNIWRCCRGIAKTSYGFKWEYLIK